jgi:hypothetical protein
MTQDRWWQTAHGRVVLLGLGWAALFGLIFTLRAAGTEAGDWRFLGYLALWLYASPLIALVGIVLALVFKVQDGPDRERRSKLRLGGLALHVLLLVVSAALLANARGG